MKTDSETKKDVEDEFHWDPDIDAIDLAISAHNGVVTLGRLRTPLEEPRWLSTVAALIAALICGMQMGVTARRSDLGELDNRALISVFSAYTVCATLWLLFATGVGILMAFKFGAPEFGPGAWLTFGRLRPIHTNATFYGFASIALVGLAYYVAARSSGAKLYSSALARTGLVLFNVAALAGTIALDLGYNDGDLEYREWPWWIRLIFLAALVVTGWNLIATVARRTSKDIYLSNWYILGSTLWTCIIAVVAIVPWYQYGLGQVAVSGFYMHNAVGMWFTPLALGVIY